MRDIHPRVKMVRDAARKLHHRIEEVRERVDGIVARRPSPSGLVIPEVDAFGHLRDLYLAPGTCARFDNESLSAEIMAAIAESVADARRQYYVVMGDRDSAPPPIAATMRKRWDIDLDVGEPPLLGTKNNGAMGGGKE